MMWKAKKSCRAMERSGPNYSSGKKPPTIHFILVALPCDEYMASFVSSFGFVSYKRLLFSTLQVVKSHSFRLVF